MTMTPVIATTALDTPVRSLPIPWRDPHGVPPAELERHIRDLEAACEQNPKSADLRTCLGMAYAMNFQVYQSMDALEAARQLDGEHFWAQAKYAELLYRLRTLERAEEETKRALDLAGNMWELSVARKQLQEIRRLRREGTQKPAWTKSLKQPAWTLVLLMALLFSLTVLWK
jgi:tetratricopeptide (TPR) repeat protein